MVEGLKIWECTKTGFASLLSTPSSATPIIIFNHGEIRDFLSHFL